MLSCRLVISICRTPTHLNSSKIVVSSRHDDMWLVKHRNSHKWHNHQTESWQFHSLTIFHTNCAKSFFFLNYINVTGKKCTSDILLKAFCCNIPFVEIKHIHTNVLQWSQWGETVVPHLQLSLSKEEQETAYKHSFNKRYIALLEASRSNTATVSVRRG